MSDNGQGKRPVLASTEELKGKKAAPVRAGKKWILPLALVLLLAGGWALYTKTSLFTPETPVATLPPDTSVKLIDRLKPDFDRVTVNKKGEAPYTIVSNIQYDADGKAIDEPDKPLFSVEGMDFFTLNVSYCSTMSNNATMLSARDTAAVDAQDLAEFGLLEPSLTVDIGYRSGEKTRLSFGDKTPVGGSHYMTMDGGKTVYVVASNAFDAFDKKLNDMHNLALPQQVDATAVKSLLIEQPGKDTIELQVIEDAQSTSISTLYLTQPIEYAAHSERSMELFEAVGVLGLSGYVGHTSAPEEKQIYGLDVPRAHVRFEDKYGQALQLWVGGSAGNGQSYVQIDQSGDVYTAPDDQLAFIANARTAYLVDQFANLVNIKMVDRLTVTGNGQTYALSIERAKSAKDDGTEEVVETYKFDGVDAEEKQFKGLYQDIIALMVDQMAEGTEQPGDVIATVRYQLNTGRPDIVIEYVAQAANSEYALVRQDGKALFLMKKDKVLNMLDRCQQFRDGTYVRTP